MSTLAIQGMQWGDEGKGKITDYFAERAEIVVRSQGGNNAGHSIVHDGKRYALRLLPSGILNENVVNVLADGMVISPMALVDEIEDMKKQGVKKFNLKISNRATVLLPYHQALDHAREAALGNAKIGTTGRGIGPAYEDKAGRGAIRMGDLLDESYLKERLTMALLLKNKELAAYGAPTFSFEEIWNPLMEAKKVIAGYITDTSLFLKKAIESGKKVLFEGAQGAMLCLTHGTYPYVTSSSPLCTAIPNNIGLGLDCVNDTIGMMKAYTTRVGEGPFPTEIQDVDLAKKVRDEGHEYGTVTKRPRRVGWLDLPQMKYASYVSGVKQVAIMLIDVLHVVDEIKICTSYSIDGKEIDYMPATVAELGKVKASYISLPSWKEDISNCQKYEELPATCRNYIETIEKLSDLEIVMVSVGPDKKQTIIRKEIF